MTRWTDRGRGRGRGEQEPVGAIFVFGSIRQALWSARTFAWGVGRVIVRAVRTGIADGGCPAGIPRGVGSGGLPEFGVGRPVL